MKSWFFRISTAVLLMFAAASPAMATIAFVQDIGTGSIIGGGSATPITIPVTAPVAAGDVVLIEAATANVGVSVTVSDSLGNNYGAARLGTSGKGDLQAFGFAATLTSGLAAGDQIVVAFATSSNQKYAAVAAAHEFSVTGTLDTSTLSNGSADNSSFGTGFDTPPSLNTLASANYLVWGYADIYAQLAVTQTTALTPMLGISAGNGITIYPAYAISNMTTGSYQFAGTLGAVAADFDAHLWTLQETPAVTPPPPPANLTIFKQHNGSNFTQGQQGAVYTLTVTNNGTANTSGTITVTDTLPAAESFVAEQNSPDWSCSATSGTPQTVTCTSTTALVHNNAYSFDLSVNLDPGFSGIVINTASVACAAPCTSGVPASDTVTVLAATPPPPPAQSVVSAPALNPWCLALLGFALMALALARPALRGKRY